MPLSVRMVFLSSVPVGRPSSERKWWTHSCCWACGSPCEWQTPGSPGSISGPHRECTSTGAWGPAVVQAPSIRMWGLLFPTETTASPQPWSLQPRVAHHPEIEPFLRDDPPQSRALKSTMSEAWGWESANQVLALVACWFINFSESQSPSIQ